MYKTVALACDHAGFSLKNELMLHLSSRGIEFRDFGTYNEESCDYPDYAAAACRAVLSGECDCAILVCGTGVGMSIAANKFDGIRNPNRVASSDGRNDETIRPTGLTGLPQPSFSKVSPWRSVLRLN